MESKVPEMPSPIFIGEELVLVLEPTLEKETLQLQPSWMLKAGLPCVTPPLMDRDHVGRMK